VKRVRGKTILVLTLIALLIGVSVSSFGVATCDTTISLIPDYITDLVPGDSFSVDIYIMDAVEVHAWELKLGYAPYMNVLVVTGVVEGDFLMGGGMTTFVSYIDHFNGFVQCGATGDADHWGVDGEGILATVVFSVVEAGDSELELYETKLLNRDQDYLDHCVEHGYYKGIVKADLYKIPQLNASESGDKVWQVGETKSFKATAIIDGPTHAYVRAKHTITSIDTGEVNTLYSGQTLLNSQPRTETEYYYVNEFTPYWTHWRVNGTSPYLDDTNDGSWVQDENYCHLIGIFGFEDITLGAADVINSVTLEAYTTADHADIDFDVYAYPLGGFAWLGSIWGTSIPLWHTPRWMTDPVSDVVPDVKTQAGFNAFTVVVHYWTPTGGSLGNATIDAMRLVVDYTGVEGAPLYESHNAGKKKPLKDAYWELYDFDVGAYTCTTEIEYKYVEPIPGAVQVWSTSEHSITYTFWVVPRGTK
jgi:hypothetical protein